MSQRRIQSVFGTPEAFVAGLQGLRRAGLADFDAYAPASPEAVGHLMPRRRSPVRFVTLVAGLAGCCLGFWMCIASALLYSLVVHGKPPVAVIPYCVIGFEVTILAGGVCTVLAILHFSRLRPQPLSPDYVAGFSADKFGLTVRAAPEQVPSVMALLRAAGAEEVHEVPDAA